jgi:hypothetical protein
VRTSLIKVGFYGNQYGLTFPLFEQYGVPLWVPEVGGPSAPVRTNRQDSTRAGAARFMSAVAPGGRPSDCVPSVLGQYPKDFGDDRTCSTLAVLIVPTWFPGVR